MRSLARWCFRHTALTLLGWVVLIVALVAIHSVVGSAYTDKFTLPSTQSFSASLDCVCGSVNLSV